MGAGGQRRPLGRSSDQGQDVEVRAWEALRGVPRQGQPLRKRRAGVVEVLGRRRAGEQERGWGPPAGRPAGTVNGFPGVLMCLDASHTQPEALRRLVYPSQEVDMCLRTCVISWKQREAFPRTSGRAGALWAGLLGGGRRKDLSRGLGPWERPGGLKRAAGGAK